MKKAGIIVLGCLLLLAAALTYARSPQSLQTYAAATITALPGQVDPYQTRAALLMEAASYTGVFTPEQAATVWSTGVERRSAALQYTVMTDRLKEIYAAQLDAAGSNWVTGMSSPWIDRFQITGRTHGGGVTSVELRFEATDSTGRVERYEVSLRLIEEDGFWRVDEIFADEAFEPYTQYRRPGEGPRPIL